MSGKSIVTLEEADRIARFIISAAVVLAGLNDRLTPPIDNPPEAGA